MRHTTLIFFALLLLGCSGPAADSTAPSTLLLPATSVPAPRAIAIESLEAESLNDGNTWRAEVTITVVDTTGSPVADVLVSGRWSEDRAASCTTDADGACAIESESLRKRVPSIELEIVDLEHPDLPYDPARNAIDDPSEPVITVSKP